MDVRQQNLNTIARFFSPEARKAGGNRFRASLFHENGTRVCAYPITRHYPTEPTSVWARDFLLEAPDVSIGMDLDAVIWATTDPNVVLAETVERGNPVICGEPRPFHGHTYHIFKLVEGEIYLWKNFFNHYALYDSLQIPYLRLDRPAIMQMEWVEDWAKNRDTMLVCREVDPIVTDGASTRIRVFGDVDESLEAQFIRRRNKEYIEECHERANYYENKGDFLVDMYTEDGCTIVPFPHQAPTECPNVFNERALGSSWPATANKYLFKDVNALYCTADPNVFWMESLGRPISGKTRYWNHYLFLFQFEKGKIRDRYEVYDPSFERDIVKHTGDAALPEEAMAFLQAL